MLWGVQAASDWPVFWAGLAALSLYYGLYEYLHWCMHNPAARRIERTRIFRYLDAHHRLHHAHWRINFNVVCPLADLVFETYRPRPAAPGSPGRLDPSSSPALRGVDRLVEPDEIHAANLKVGRYDDQTAGAADEPVRPRRGALTTIVRTNGAR